MIKAANDDTDGEAPETLVFIILGEARKAEDEAMLPFNGLISAADDDSAVRAMLEALASEGYVKADLHQIGNIDHMPDDEPFASAYQAALDGEVAIIAFEGEEISGLGGLQ